ncbi:MAG: hypothetical protein VX836_04175 [Pseudomonadota bacterium]|nr:hypothetical protein [Pseudomonadota bacterium]
MKAVTACWIALSLLGAAMPTLAGDPMAPELPAEIRPEPKPVQRRAAPGLPAVDAIFCTQSSCRALVQGHTVAVGDRVAGARITAIDARGVDLDRPSRQNRLHLSGADAAAHFSIQE